MTVATPWVMRRCRLWVPSRLPQVVAQQQQLQQRQRQRQRQQGPCQWSNPWVYLCVTCFRSGCASNAQILEASGRLALCVASARGEWRT
jgi:hypothetical protein